MRHPQATAERAAKAGPESPASDVNAAEMSAEEAVAYLPPNLCRSLALLADAPSGVAELTLVTMPYEGTLRTLESLGLIAIGRKEVAGSPNDGAGDDANELLEVKLTARGHDAIQLCSSRRGPLALASQDYEYFADVANVDVKVMPA